MKPCGERLTAPGKAASARRKRRCAGSARCGIPDRRKRRRRRQSARAAPRLRGLQPPLRRSTDGAAESTHLVVERQGQRRDIYNQEDVMSIRFQKTPRGEVAILPRKDYELWSPRQLKLMKMPVLRIVARARKEIAGGGPLLPKDIVDRLAGGENPVRVLREWREREWPEGMTQMVLSHKTNLSQGYISDIENGRRTGTAAALRLIANVLEVPLDLLVQDA
jgi:hypothetical protein